MKPSSRHHHGSHRQLLSRGPEVPFPAAVDAIIVPTVRDAAALEPAINLAATLNSTLVVLCSRWSSADAVAELAEKRNVELVAVDVAQVGEDLLPRFRTSELLSRTMFHVRADTSVKRNLGLLLAHLVGWQRIVFLDDDIVVPEPADLNDAAGLTDQYAGVGLSLGGFPDNSVVCHAYREAGGQQDTFIGGGALAVGTRSAPSFFPRIYNEDWFFLLGDGGLRSTTATGTALQKPYDPFAGDRRARQEELGDTLAEGLFWRLDTGLPIADADVVFWRQSLERRADFITDVIDMVSRTDRGDPERRGRMLSSLKAARGRGQLIDPNLCVRYLDAWRADQLVWQRHVDILLRTHVAEVKAVSRAEGPRDPGKLIASLGIAHATRYLRPG
jgi:hypothetical protein